MLDLGQGSFAELWRYRSPATVTAVVISHLHADHNVDLIPLRHWVKYANDGDGPALHGPTELRERFTEFQGPYSSRAPTSTSSTSSRRRADRGRFQIGDLTIEAGPRHAHSRLVRVSRVRSGERRARASSTPATVACRTICCRSSGRATRCCARPASALERDRPTASI